MTQSTSEPWGSHGPRPLAPDLCFLLTSGNQESIGSSRKTLGTQVVF